MVTILKKFQEAQQNPAIVDFFSLLFEKAGIRVVDTGEEFSCYHRGTHINFESPLDETSMPEEEYADYIIEGARSSRSKCKTCRKAIEKDVLRLGILIEGPYGIGYLWHHLTCAAKRRIDDVEVAFEQQAWEKAKLRPNNIPSIEEMRSINKKSQLKRENSKKIPLIT